MRLLALAIALCSSACAVAHERAPDTCVEEGPVGCLIRRPCWCSLDADAGVARCTTCRSSCASADCACYFGGGVEVDASRCE